MTTRKPRRRQQASTTARGYGAEHQKLRATLLPRAYGQPCPRCGRPMLEGQDLDLGHTEDRTGYNGIEHADCNRRAGARKGNRKRGRRRAWTKAQTASRW